MQTYQPILPRFRSRWAVALQTMAMLCMLLQPLTVNSYWTISASSGVKEEVENPPPEDPWWEQHGDYDDMANAEEVAFGSDPYRTDPDFDGLTDRDERDLTLAMNGGVTTTDPWLWDSDSDGYSDYDEYYNWLQGTPLHVNYASLPAGYNFVSYYDADGDGINNPEDGQPLDHDNDGLMDHEDVWPNDPNNVLDDDEDGHPNLVDSHPGDSERWSDGDNDGRNVDDDSHPANVNLWSDWNGNGTNHPTDGDEDGVPDGDDSHPRNAAFFDDWDNDGWDSHMPLGDSHPYDANFWSDWDGNYQNNDTDGDEDGTPNIGDSHPTDYTLWSDWNFDNDNNEDDWDEDGFVNGITTDSDPANPSLWCDWDHDGDNDPGGLDPDGDGVISDNDSHPENNSRWSDWNDDGDNNDDDGDEDGYADGWDSHPHDASRWCDVDDDGSNDPWLVDSDGDTVLDINDSHTVNPDLWSDWNNDGDNNETDGDEDGYANGSDTHPHDSSRWCDSNNDGVNDPDLIDTDWDTSPDVNDSHPQDGNLWNDWNNDGDNNDSDGDEDTLLDGDDSDPRNPSLWSDWNRDGDNSDYDWDEDGTVNGDDSHPKNFHLWSDSDNDGRNAEDDSHPNSATLWEDWNNDGANDPDTDGDGIVDGRDNYPSDPQNGQDDDSDGLSNYEETNTHHTNPLSVDTDNDYLTDSEELLVFNTNPLDPHSVDGVRLDWLATGAGMGDADEDGIPNKIESFYGLNINDPQDAHGDLDGDGVSNLFAYQAGLSLRASLPNYDEDGDRIPNAVEDYWATASPGVLSSSNPADALEDPDNDGLLNFEEVRFGLNLLDSSTHGTQADLAFVNLHFGKKWLPAKIAGDTDGDGMSDVFEHRYGWRMHAVAGLDLRNPTDAGRDPDHDHLSSLNEFRFNSNPLIRETQTGTSDGTRFHTRPGGSGGGGLLSRYRSQIAQELAAGQLKDFSVDNVVTPPQNQGPPDGGGGDPPGEPPTCGRTHCSICLGEGEVDCPICQGQNPDCLACVDGWVPCGCPNGDCSACMGSGRLPPVDCPSCPSTCQTCGGDGQWMGACWACWGLDENCGTCGGTNQQLYQCDSCAGGGLTSTACQSCGGAGTLPGDPCSPCNGTGFCPSCLGIAGHVCESCNGRGSLNNNCSTCDGSGEIDCDACVDGMDDLCDCQRPDCTCYGVDCICFPDDGGGGAPGGGDDPIYLGSASIMTSTGQRHRKIGLNGVPLPDSKPQAQDESGEAPEETYIDTFGLQLRHSISDVYVPLQDSLLPLTVRRDVTQESWSPRYSLLPDERPELAFGPGWSTNLCSYVRYEAGGGSNSTALAKAVVVDEQGQQQVFLYHDYRWTHASEDIRDPKTWFDTLDGSLASTMVLRKKFGTTCEYTPVYIPQDISSDRISGGGAKRYTYFRLTKVTDRWGNELRYTYPPAPPPPSNQPGQLMCDTLIPSKIYDPARLGHSISITQSGGRVTQVKTPGGEIVNYNYSARTMGAGTADPDNAVESFSVLTSVTRGGTTVGYGYDLQQQEEPPRTEDNAVPRYRYLALNRIQDEMGREYQFYWQTDNSVKTSAYEDNKPVKRFGSGLPMLLSGVVRPDGGVLRIYGSRLRGEGPQIDLDGQAYAPTVVNAFASDAGFHTYVYPSQDVTVHSPNVKGYWQGADEDVTNIQAIANYCHVEVRMGLPPLWRNEYQQATGHPAPALTPVLEECYFHARAGMALYSATDLSGNVTRYVYDDPAPRDLFPGANQPQVYYDDPTSETNAFGTSQAVTRYFTYHAGTRILSSMTDERDVTTTYTIDSVGRRTAETVSTAEGVVKQTQYRFDDALFPGRMTEQTTDLASTDTMPATVTRFLLGQPEASNPSWWREETVVNGYYNGNGVFVPLSESTTIDDFDGRKRMVIDPNGNATSFEYDAAGRLSRVIHPDEKEKTLAYDPHGNLIRETDEAGTKTFHQYDVLNQRIRTTLDLNGNNQADASYTTQTADETTGAPDYNGDIVTTSTYNARGQVLTQTDPRGKVTTHVYDDHGRLTSTNDGGIVTSFAYGPNSGGRVFDTTGFKPTQIIDPRGLVTTITYDKRYRPLTTSTTLGGTTTTTYDAMGNPVSVNDALNRITYMEYDALGQCVKKTNPDGTFTRQFYTHHGKLWKSIDEMGAVTVTNYDAIGRATSVIMPPAVQGAESAVFSTEYDPAGNVVKVVDPLGRATYTTYDARNRPVSVHAARVWDSVNGVLVWPETVTTYDAVGRVTSVQDHTGAMVSTFYDRAGRAWKTTDPLNHATLSTYDAGGAVLTVKDALSRTVTNQYDIRGQLVTTTDGAGIVNEFEYDAAGNRTKVIDGLGQETVFVYDLLNRLTSQTFANGDTWNHAYNKLQKTSQTDPKGVVTTYTYDARDRLLTSAAPGLARTRSYDACGRLLNVVETGRPQATVAHTYDALGRLISESSRGLVHHYVYDLAGNRVRAEYGTGQVVETSYDALNRPETIAQGDQLTRYGYDLAGRAVILVAANGQVTENTFDVAGRLINRVLFPSLTQRGNNDVLAEFGWAHDDVGNVVAQHEVWPGSAARAAGVRATTMTYDGANRLQTETIVDPEQGTIATAYAYDDANNRDSKTVTGGTEPGYWDYTYNEANQLTAWERREAPGGTLIKSAVLTYDLNGNRTGQTVTEGAETKLTGYAWDAQDRLSSVTTSASGGTPTTIYHYDYDYRTRRIGTHETTTTIAKHTTIAFSGGLSLAEWESQGSAPVTTNPPTVEYTRGPDMGGGVGGLLYSQRGNSTTAKYNVSNGRGDIVAQSDSSGSLTWTASYEAYGKRTKETGTNADKQRANTKDEDPTGLLNEGFRYRDLETGVWLSRDPAGFVDGPNLYAYVQQNPWTKFDPEGLFWGAIIGAGVDIFMQTVVEGRSFSQINKTRVLASAALGLVTGGVSAFAAKGMAAAGTSMAGRMAMGAAIGANAGVAQNAIVNADYGRPLMENADKAAAFGAAGGALFEPAMRGMGAADDAIAAVMSKGGKPPPPSPGGQSAQVAGEVAAAEANAQLKPGDVMKYRDYLAAREKGSSLRGHHIPQSKRLEELGIDKMEGTVVVMEGAEHTPTRTFGGRGPKTAAAERGTPLSNSESLDLADPPVQKMGAGVAEKVRQMNRENHPDHFSN